MIKILLSSVFLICFFSTAIQALYYNNTANVAGFGTLQGMTMRVNQTGTNVTVNAFLGVPYAQPPVGNLRFSYAQPPLPYNTSSSSSTFNATRFGNICPQLLNGLFMFPNPTLSEDCLTLNIWAPDTPGLKPVLFWVHAGAFLQGSGSELRYHGQYQASANNIVVVTINYRLGAFGFLAHPSLMATFNNTGTMGLSDQAMAFQWVVNNIASFGGDRNQITFGGVSAGGAATTFALGNPSVSQYISKAIMQSFDPLSQAQSMFEAMTQGDAIAGFLLCNGTDAQVVACLNNKTYNDYIYLQQYRSVAKAMVDGVFLRDAPYNLITKNMLKRVPTLFGSTQDEVTLFIYTSQTAPVPPAGYMPFAKSQLNGPLPQSEVTVSSQLYPCQAYNASDCRNATAVMVSDAFITCQAALVGYSIGTFSYLWNHRPSFYAPAFVPGVPHLSELEFVFSTIYEEPINFTSDEAALARVMTRYWGTFINTGNPNYNGSPFQWPPYVANASNPGRARFTTSQPDLITNYKTDLNPNTAGCGYWFSQIYPLTVAQEVTADYNQTVANISCPLCQACPTASPSPNSNAPSVSYTPTVSPTPGQCNCPSPTTCPTYTPTPTPSPSCCNQGTSTNDESSTEINFFFADMLAR